MNQHPKDPSFFEFGHHAYSLMDGITADQIEENWWDDSGLTQEQIQRASYWKYLGNGEPQAIMLATMLDTLYRTDGVEMNPYPGDAPIIGETIEIRWCGEAERVLVWRDMAINWYKRPGRCMCASRFLESHEYEQFLAELRALLGVAQPVDPA